MISALLAVMIGAGIGLFRGGRLQNLSGLTVDYWQLLAVGVTLPLLVAWTDPPGGALVVVIGLLCLISFALANFRLAGMGVVAFGLFLNLVPIAANGAMPVSPEAMVNADLAANVGAAELLKLQAPREIQQAGDYFVFLGDIIPIGLLDQVLSFGDLVLLVGLADVVMNRVRRRFREEEVPVVLPAEGGLEPALSNRQPLQA